MKSFKELFADAEKIRKERIRKAGKHVCIKRLAGTISRITKKRGGAILKHPIIVRRFYECKICGKDMK